MEGTWKWATLTAVAPIAWGSNHFVTHRYLPAGVPLWGATIRALPAGLLLIGVTRSRPNGSWWWRSVVLGTLNIAVFFGLIYVAAQRLPSSTAAMVMANSPVTLMLVAWAVIAERPRARSLAGAAVGIGGAALMLGAGSGGVDAVGIAASLAAMTVSAFGFMLTTRWSRPPDSPDVVAVAGWQLTAGGLMSLPLAALAHGAPPSLDGAAVGGFAYVVVVATAIAFAAWFAGLRHLPAASVGLIGLLNPVTGVLLGTAISGESLSGLQVIGIALVFAGIAGGQRRRATPGPRPGTRRRPAVMRASTAAAGG